MSSSTGIFTVLDIPAEPGETLEFIDSRLY
jgi:hypothetical protein